MKKNIKYIHYLVVFILVLLLYKRFVHIPKDKEIVKIEDISSAAPFERNSTKYHGLVKYYLANGNTFLDSKFKYKIGQVVSR